VCFEVAFITSWNLEDSKISCSLVAGSLALCNCPDLLPGTVIKKHNTCWMNSWSGTEACHPIQQVLYSSISIYCPLAMFLSIPAGWISVHAHQERLVLCVQLANLYTYIKMDWCYVFLLQSSYTLWSCIWKISGSNARFRAKLVLNLIPIQRKPIRLWLGVSKNTDSCEICSFYGGYMRTHVMLCCCVSGFDISQERSAFTFKCCGGPRRILKCKQYVSVFLHNITKSQTQQHSAMSQKNWIFKNEDQWNISR